MNPRGRSENHRVMQILINVSIQILDFPVESRI
jgi:hypothetical protein